MLWFKVARRYMFSPKSHSVINIIATVSVIAVAVPTAAMIILLAMFGGLGNTISEIYSAVDADIEVVAARGQTFHSERIAPRAIADIEGIEQLSAYIEQEVVASARGRRTTLLLRGVDSLYCEVLPIEGFVARGTTASISRGDIVLGYGIASTLSTLGLGSEVELLALNRRTLSTLLPLSGISRDRMAVGGIVLSNTEINNSLAIADLGRVQQLLNHKGRLSGIAIKIGDGADIYGVEREIEELLGAEFEVRTREEKNASMNAIIDMERSVIALIGVMIALVATFAIVGSVVMLITDKRRDIATLRAMGASRQVVHHIFVGEGALLTTIGCIAGLIIGLGFCLGQQHFGWIAMPGFSMLDSYPVDISVGDTLFVVAVIVALGVVISHLTVRKTLDKQL